MNKKVYISLAALTGISLGTLLALKSQKKDFKNTTVSIDDKEDSYVKGGWTASEKQTEAYKRLLLKWGTKEGLIDVRDNSLASKKEQQKKRLRKLSKIEKKGKELAKIQQERIANKPIEKLKDLANDYEVTQVIINNNTAIDQSVNLWGSNAEVMANSIAGEEENFTTRVGVQPQNAIYNPANNLFYVVNQLSDSVCVVTSNSELVATIRLNTSLFLGIVSPVDLSVNTNTESPKYGYVYVIGSVSDTIYEITTAHEISNTYPTEKRPISIVFNAVNNSFYVANLASGSLTKLSFVAEGDTEILGNTINGFADPKVIGIHQGNGTIYVFNGASQSITVLDTSDQVLKSEIDVGTTEGSFAYHIENAQIYFSQSALDTVIAFDPLSLEVSAVISVGNAPNRLAYHTTRALLYVANQLDQNYSLIGVENEVVDTIELVNFSNGLAISTIEDTVLSTHIPSASLFMRRANSPAITFNKDYMEYREDFQHNPALLKHVRVINSGDQKLNVLEHIRRTISGKEERRTYSFRNYESPQHFNRTSEITDLKDKIIDGNNSWNLNVPAGQRLTVLFYHKQLETYDLLPETARKSIGVEMSKGIPKQWK